MILFIFFCLILMYLRCTISTSSRDFSLYLFKLSSHVLGVLQIWPQNGLRIALKELNHSGLTVTKELITLKNWLDIVKLGSDPCCCCFFFFFFSSKGKTTNHNCNCYYYCLIKCFSEVLTPT